jgi:hypothetical protein
MATILFAFGVCAQEVRTLPSPGAAGGGATSPTDSAPTAAPAPAPVAPKVFYLEVDANDLAVISGGLMELPKKIADPMILKLNGQLTAQAPIIEHKEAAETERKRKSKK